MKGLGISKFPNRFCSLWLACQVTVLFGAIVAAEENSVDGAQQIEVERNSQIEDATKIGQEAAELSKAGNYSESAVNYAKAIAQLGGMPGEVAREEKMRLEMEYGAMKMVWIDKIMSSAEGAFDQGNYTEAAKLAADAVLVDPAMVDEVNAFTERCMHEIDYADYSTQTKIDTIAPELSKNEHKMAILLKQADVYERAYRFEEAKDRLEKIFLIDPLNTEASERLQKLYKKLYGAVLERGKGVRYGISAAGAWTFVPQVMDNSVDIDTNNESKEHASNSDLYRALENIKVSVDYDEATVLEVVNEQNRTLSRAEELRASIVTRFTQQVGDDLPKINLTLTEVPLIDLLRYVCMQANLQLRVDENSVVLGLADMDALTTRSFPVSSDLIYDAAEAYSNYYYLDSIAAASEERDESGGFESEGTSNLGLNNNRNSRGGGGGGGAGMMDGPMGAMMGGGANSNSDFDASGRLVMNRREAGSRLAEDANSYVSNGLTEMGVDMSVLGVSVDGEGEIDQNTMGGIAGGTPPVSSVALIEFFELRGIPFNNNATISYNRRTGELLATNTVENLRKLEDLLQQLEELRSPQVYIEAKLIELTESDVEELGFDWFLDIKTNDADTTWWVPTNENPLRHYSSDNAHSASLISDSYSVINDLKIFPNFGEALFGENGDVNLSLSVNALAQSSSTEVLNAPQVTTVSGDMAVIKTTHAYYYPESWTEPEIDIDNDTM